MYSCRFEFSIDNNDNDKNKAADSKREKIQKHVSGTKTNNRLSCRENIHEYLLNSTLHGLKYMADRTINRLER